MFEIYIKNATNLVIVNSYLNSRLTLTGLPSDECVAEQEISNTQCHFDAATGLRHGRFVIYIIEQIHTIN